MCEHRNIKKNYPFGRKSKPEMYCKDCGEVLKPKDLEKIKIKRRKSRR